MHQMVEMNGYNNISLTFYHFLFIYYCLCFILNHRSLFYHFICKGIEKQILVAATIINLMPVSFVALPPASVDLSRLWGSAHLIHCMLIEQFKILWNCDTWWFSWMLRSFCLLTLTNWNKSNINIVRLSGLWLSRGRETKWVVSVVSRLSWYPVSGAHNCWVLTVAAGGWHTRVSPVLHHNLVLTWCLVLWHS